MNTINELIQRNEGFSKNPYRDSEGHLTIGYGRNLDAKGISVSEALMMFQDDRRAAEDAVHDNLRSSVPPAGSARYAALVDMAFTLGADGFAGFDKMIAAIYRKDWEEAAKEALKSKWGRKQATERAKRDARMIRTNEWPEESR